MLIKYNLVYHDLVNNRSYISKDEYHVGTNDKHMDRSQCLQLLKKEDLFEFFSSAMIGHEVKQKTRVSLQGRPTRNPPGTQSRSSDVNWQHLTILGRCRCADMYYQAEIDFHCNLRKACVVIPPSRDLWHYMQPITYSRCRKRQRTDESPEKSDHLATAFV